MKERLDEAEGKELVGKTGEEERRIKVATKQIKGEFKLRLHKQQPPGTLFLAVTHPEHGTGGGTFFLKIELPFFMTEADFLKVLGEINVRLCETE